MDERDEWLTRLRVMRLAWPVRCQRVFAPEEMALLRQGLWPATLDERWAVWLDGGLLRVWRAGTGECIYESEVSEDDTGAGQCRVLRVCDDTDVYTRASGEAGEVDRFEGVLAMLLGRRKEAAA